MKPMPDIADHSLDVPRPRLQFGTVELHTGRAGPDLGTVIGDLQVRAASATGDAVFVGIGPAGAVEQYLARVERDRIVDLGPQRRARQQHLSGAAPNTPPTAQSFWVASATGTHGVVRDRFVALITHLAHDRSDADNAQPKPANSGPTSGVGIVEGLARTITHRVELGADGALTRVKIVDPSFFNWPALPVALADTIGPDFPLTNKSFNLSYAGNDL